MRHAVLVSATGNGPEAEELQAVLAERGVNPADIILSSQRRTTVKTRIIAHSQQVVRLDQEKTNPISDAEAEKILEAIEKIFQNSDIVIISDYAKGVVTPKILKRLIMESGKTVVVDPKGKDYSKYLGASILTPNRREAAEACHLENDTQDLVEKAGNKLIFDLGLKGLLITQSEDGMTLFRPDAKAEHIETAVREIYDVTGAGDTVIACLGASIATGADYFSAAKIANIGAGIVIRQLGTTQITADRLLAELGSARGISG